MRKRTRWRIAGMLLCDTAAAPLFLIFADRRCRLRPPAAGLAPVWLPTPWRQNTRLDGSWWCPCRPLVTSISPQGADRAGNGAATADTALPAKAVGLRSLRCYDAASPFDGAAGATAFPAVWPTSAGVKNHFRRHALARLRLPSLIRKGPAASATEVALAADFDECRDTRQVFHQPEPAGLLRRHRRCGGSTENISGEENRRVSSGGHCRRVSRSCLFAGSLSTSSGAESWPEMVRDTSHRCQMQLPGISQEFDAQLERLHDIAWRSLLRILAETSPPANARRGRESDPRKFRESRPRGADRPLSGPAQKDIRWPAWLVEFWRDRNLQAWLQKLSGCADQRQLKIYSGDGLLLAFLDYGTDRRTRHHRAPDGGIAFRNN